MFIDYVEIEVQAGRGGHGCISFHTEKFVPKGGPDGGDGGRGGDIVVESDPNLTTLLDYRYRRKYKAPNGRPGEGSLRTGKSATPIVLRLPVGTLIKDLDSGQLIADLDQPAQQEVVAKGGKGGYGNTHYKSPTNQAPRKAQDGFSGVGRRLGLELKLLADVGLVGQPNAGKSTILASFSAARPKIADYPFTTLKPNLGIVRLGEFRSFVMADIPGLIEGAAGGKGLGVQFLKHIQRTRLLIYVIDINESSIDETLAGLKNELKEFDPKLIDKPFLVAVTKTDTLSESDLKSVSNNSHDSYIFMSAVSHSGTDDFLIAIERELDRLRSERTTD